MHSGNIADLEDSFHIKQIFIRENLLKVFFTLIICAAFSNCVNLFISFIVLPSMPIYTARAYADCLSNKDYVKAEDFYTEVPDIERLKENDIISTLQNIFGNAQKIEVVEVVASPVIGTYRAVLNVTREGRSSFSSILLKNTGNSFLGIKKEWKVTFPFTTVNLEITGIEGLKIFMDGCYAGCIKDGKLDIKSVIYGKHTFRADLDYIASMKDTCIDVEDSSCCIKFQALPTEEFKKSMENLISGFCSSWSSYCLNQDPSAMRKYVADRLYNRYTNDTGIFQGSNFTICQYSMEFKDLIIENDSSAYYVVDEKWHLKEEITDPNLIFEVNGKTELEQEQYMTWKYHVFKDSVSWKIDGTEQISFKQNVLD